MSIFNFSRLSDFRQGLYVYWDTFACLVSEVSARLNEITTEQIGDHQVTDAKVADRTLTATKVQAGTLTDTEIAPTAGISISKLEAVPEAQIIVGNGATPSVATLVDMSGDVTISKDGVTTIGDGKVNEDMLASTVAVVPSGGIILWSGSIVNIPSGWALCDGSNGTPNLRDKFVIGAGSTYAVGASASTATHKHTGPSHSHDSGSITSPLHLADGHMWWDELDTIPFYTSKRIDIGTITTIGVNTHVSRLRTYGSTGDAGTGDTGTASHLPPYYALCYIMKL